MTPVERLRYVEAPAKPVNHPGSRSSPADRSGSAAGTLVLIHAFPLSANMWERQLVLAEQGWRIIAPHLRGFDGQAADKQARSVDDYAGDIVDLLDSLHVESAVIAGLSLGGYVAFALLRHASRYFRGLVLADTRSEADTPEGLKGRDRMIALVGQGGASAIADEMVPKLLGDTTKAERPDIVERVSSLILSNTPEAIEGALYALKTRPDSTPLLPTIHFPTLILVGEEDTVTPPALSENMHRAIGGSELVRIPKAGHLSNLEQPDAFNQALAHFLAYRV